MGITGQDTLYMQEALRLAKTAADAKEVPVGAVVVASDGQIIGRGHNQSCAEQDPTAHAEMLAIREACRFLGNYRLSGCSLFVTLEPCPMCASAIAQARLSRVVFALRDFKMGACGSVYNLVNPHANKTAKIALDEGLCRDNALILLQQFFEQRR